MHKGKKIKPFGRRVLLIALFVFVATCPSVAREWTTVRWVDDGDTVVMENGTRVRYIGINAPEIAHADEPEEPYGAEARTLNQKLVWHQTVRLVFDQERYDRHGRLLAYLFRNDGLFVNGELVRRGAAYYLPYRKNLTHAGRLLQAQREAMSSRVGLWSLITDDGGNYIGNRSSGRFHRKDCPYAKKISKGSRVYFKTKQDAFWAGFAPAKQCLQTYWR